MVELVVSVVDAVVDVELVVFVDLVLLYRWRSHTTALN